MSHLQIISHELASDSGDIRLRCLSFRCRSRGTQESDLILGTFADNVLASLDGTQLDRFEALLDCTDPDLFDWIICGIAPPPEHDHDVMRMLRAFSDRPKRPPANAACPTRR